MSDKELINELIKKSRIAQEEFESFSQESVDAIVKKIGKIIFDNARIIAEEAFIETGFGSIESKTFKLTKTCMAAWSFLRDKKSIGIIDEDPVNQVFTYAKPVGVIACLSPSTNPVSTIVSNVMNSVKSLNSVIIAPHPNAKKVSKHGVDLMNEELRRMGAPNNLIQLIEEPSLQLAKLLISNVDVVVATGGASMVKAAYSSGKPSYGVGQGNVQAIVSDDYTDFDNVAQTVVKNRSYDNGIPCTCEQSIYFPRRSEKELINAFKKFGAYLIQDIGQINKLSDCLFLKDNKIDLTNVGVSAFELAKKIGIEIPQDVKILLVEAQGKGEEHLLCKEKLCPVLQYYIYDKFSEALEIAKINLQFEGAGHTSTLFTFDKNKAKCAGEKLPVARIVVNQSGSAASGGSLENGLHPTMSLGCGSWGNNSISENLTYQHLMNITKVAFRKKDFAFPKPEEIWGE